MKLLPPNERLLNKLITAATVGTNIVLDPAAISALLAVFSTDELPRPRFPARLACWVHLIN